ncbi:Maf family protein [Glaciecola sp. 1036]|uniref:Maf family protein n=1 Tax=Alteromonadaceae TaxID=72275 RepID=UPI003D065BA0
MKKVILASASPRRAELLNYLLAEYSIQPSDIDETPLANETPESLVARLAQGKAQHIYQTRPTSVVLGSDTIIGFQQQILGKPTDKNHFIGMMQALSNNVHQVYTGISVVSNLGCFTKVVITQVKFAELSDADINQYWATGEPADKAGGYAIQGYGGQFVKSIEGSVSAVIGLPLVETKELLKQAGVLSDC